MAIICASGSGAAKGQQRLTQDLFGIIPTLESGTRSTSRGRMEFDTAAGRFNQTAVSALWRKLRRQWAGASRSRASSSQMKQARRRTSGRQVLKVTASSSRGRRWLKQAVSDISDLPGGLCCQWYRRQVGVKPGRRLRKDGVWVSPRLGTGQRTMPKLEQHNVPVI